MEAVVTKVTKHRIYGVIPPLPRVGPLDVTVQYGDGGALVLDGSYHFRSLPDAPEVTLGSNSEPREAADCVAGLGQTCESSVMRKMLGL